MTLVPNEALLSAQELYLSLIIESLRAMPEPPLVILGALEQSLFIAKELLTRQKADK